MPERSGLSLENSPKLLDDGPPRGVVLLEQDQELGHRLLPPLVELANHVGADLLRGREDAEKIAASAG